MKQQFRFDHLKQGSSMLVTLEGDIGEQSEFVYVDLSDTVQLQVETNKVRYINSYGVSKWVNWLNSVRTQFPRLPIILSNVPYVLVKQVMTVLNFVPEGTKIQSLIVPYYCESCTVNDWKTFNLHDDFPERRDSNQVDERLISSVPCQKCGAKMALEASLGVYTSVISKYG